MEALYTSGNLKTVDMAMFSLAFGAFLTILVTLATVDIANARTNAVFWAALIVAGLASVFFALRAIIAWRSALRSLQAIKRSPP